MFRHNLAIAALTSALLIGTAAEAATVRGTDAIRSAPNQDAATTGQVRSGDSARVQRCTGEGWCFVESNGKSGWVGPGTLDGTDGAPIVEEPAQPAQGGGGLFQRKAPGATQQPQTQQPPAQQPQTQQPRREQQQPAPQAEQPRRDGQQNGGQENGRRDGDRPNGNFSGGSFGGGDRPNGNFNGGNGGDNGRRGDAPRSRGPRAEVCFYSDENFRGRSFCAEPGDAERNLDDWDDRISSIQITGDAAAQVCVDSRFRGRCEVFDESQRRLSRRLNDEISSYRVE